MRATIHKLQRYAKRTSKKGTDGAIPRTTTASDQCELCSLPLPPEHNAKHREPISPERPNIPPA